MRGVLDVTSISFVWSQGGPFELGDRTAPNVR
jgi:hypothetical protein